jgi:hypothetical protein
MFLDVQCQFVAFHSGHVEICDYQIKAFILYNAQCLLAAPGRFNDVAIRGQDNSERLQNPRLVIDQKYSFDWDQGLCPFLKVVNTNRAFPLRQHAKIRM